MSKAWSRDLFLDKNTFGSSKACHILVDLMNQNEIQTYQKHKVLSFLHQLRCDIKQTNLLKNQIFKRKILNLLLNESLQKIDNMNFSVKFTTFLKNVTHYMCKV